MAGFFRRKRRIIVTIVYAVLLCGVHSLFVSGNDNKRTMAFVDDDVDDARVNVSIHMNADRKSPHFSDLQNGLTIEDPRNVPQVSQTTTEDPKAPAMFRVSNELTMTGKLGKWLIIGIACFYIMLYLNDVADRMWVPLHGQRGPRDRPDRFNRP